MSGQSFNSALYMELQLLRQELHALKQPTHLYIQPGLRYPLTQDEWELYNLAAQRFSFQVHLKKIPAGYHLGFSADTGQLCVSFGDHTIVPLDAYNLFRSVDDRKPLIDPVTTMEFKGLMNAVRHQTDLSSPSYLPEQRIYHSSEFISNGSDDGDFPPSPPYNDNIPTNIMAASKNALSSNNNSQCAQVKTVPSVVPLTFRDSSFCPASTPTSHNYHQCTFHSQDTTDPGGTDDTTQPFTRRSRRLRPQESPDVAATDWEDNSPRPHHGTRFPVLDLHDHHDGSASVDRPPTSFSQCFDTSTNHQVCPSTSINQQSGLPPPPDGSLDAVSQQPLEPLHLPIPPRGIADTQQELLSRLPHHEPWMNEFGTLVPIVAHECPIGQDTLLRKKKNRFNLFKRRVSEIHDVAADSRAPIDQNLQELEMHTVDFNEYMLTRCTQPLA